MRRLLFVRSGQTPWDASADEPDQKRLQGIVPLPLTESAKNSLALLAKRMLKYSPEMLYSSGNESAGPTATFLSGQMDLKHKKLPELHELNCGLWQGLRISDIKQRYCKSYKQWLQDPSSIRPPQGELLEELINRVKPSLELMDCKCAGKSVVLVTAPIVGAAIMCCLKGIAFTELWQVLEDTKDLEVFDFDNKGRATPVPVANKTITSSITELNNTNSAQIRNKVV